MSESLSNRVLVTGGAGLIGANFVHLLRRSGIPVLNLDKLTYAGNPASLAGLQGDADYVFVRGDIGDQPLMTDLLEKYRPFAICNFAAESHVDRSILGPKAFVETNVQGTFALLEAARAFWAGLTEPHQSQFRFLQVSTDEVFGTLAPDDPAFSETTAYAPNSPYAASKAAADHFVRAYFHTYGFPVLTTNCSNNYGPYQFPEKLIPLMILNAMEGKPLPVYGDGLQVRDWLYVEDHCQAILTVLQQGAVGQTYNVGGRSERTNLDVVTTICRILDEALPDSPHRPFDALITHVADRPGHDRRYAINDTLLRSELDWRPEESFESGIRKTVAWYLEHADWIESIRTGAYKDWVDANYAERLGKSATS